MNQLSSDYPQMPLSVLPISVLSGSSGFLTGTSSVCATVSEDIESREEIAVVAEHVETIEKL